MPTSVLPVNTIPTFPSQSAYVPQPVMTAQGYPYGQDTGVNGWNSMTQQQMQQRQQSQMHQQYLPQQPQQFQLQQPQQQPQQQQQPPPQSSQMMQQPSFVPVPAPKPSVLISAATSVSVIEDDFEFSEFTSATTAPSATSSVHVTAPTGVMTSSSSNHFGDLIGSIDSNSLPTGIGIDDEMGDFMTADSSTQLDHTSNQPHSHSTALASVSVDSNGTPRSKPSASEMMDNMLASMSTNILAPLSPPPSLKSLLTPSLTTGGDQSSSSPVVTPTKQQQQQRSSPRNERMVLALHVIH